MSPRLTPTVSALIAGLLLGCSSTKPINEPTAKTPTPTELVRRVESNSPDFQTLRGTGNITFESQEMSGSASCDVTLKRPDSVLVKLTGPFGIGVATALLTRSQFTMYNSFDNKVITGEPTQKNLRRIFRQDATFDDVLNMMSGGMKLRRPSAYTEVSVVDDQYLLLAKFGDDTERYWIDPERLIITKYQLLNSAGRLIAEQSYSKFKEYDGRFFPHLVHVLRPLEKQALSLYYDSIEPNTKDLNFYFSIPENAQRLRWEGSRD